MTDDDFEKLKFHIRLLGQTIDASAYPTESLVLSLDWSEADLNAAHDIFEAFDKMLSEGDTVDWSALEREFEKKLQLDYQGLKSVVLAFYRNSQWVDVCVAYAQDKPCLEFDEIIRSRKSETPASLDDSVEAQIRRARIPFSKNAAVGEGRRKHFVDFLCTIDHRRVAIETKQGRFSNMRAEAASKWATELLSTGLVDDVWLITVAPFNAASSALFSGQNVRVMTLNELASSLKFS